MGLKLGSATLTRSNPCRFTCSCRNVSLSSARIGLSLISELLLSGDAPSRAARTGIKQDRGIAAVETAPALHLLNGEKNLIRKAGNAERHRSPTNQQSFRLIGSLRQRSLASWQTLLADRHSKSRYT